MSDRKVIPKEFYKADHEPVIVETVKDLKQALLMLPDDLSIDNGFGDAVRVVVYNVSMGSPMLALEEWDYD